MSKEAESTLKPKIPLIIDRTLEVLRDQGEKGFSMRKVAAKARMSLGNLQFYSQNKDDPLKGMVAVYFERCEADFTTWLMAQPHGERRETIKFLVEYVMDYAHSDIKAVFRELWAMAAKNTEVIVTNALKASEGYTQLIPGAIIIIGCGTAFIA